MTTQTLSPATALPTILDMVEGFSSALNVERQIAVARRAAEALGALAALIEGPAELSWVSERDPRNGIEKLVAESGEWLYAVVGHVDADWRVTAWSTTTRMDLGTYDAVWKAMDEAENHAAGAYGAK